MGTDTYIPAALRPFTTQLTPSTCRVRVSTTHHCIYVHGVLLGTLTQGSESVYFKTPGGRGELFANVEEFDTTYRNRSRR